MKVEKKLKELGYGVAIHYNEYKNLFEVYKIGTYQPSSPEMNKEKQLVAKDKSLKKAMKKYSKQFAV